MTVVSARLIITLGIWIAGSSSIISQQTAPERPPAGVPSDATLFNGKWYRVYLMKTTWKRAQERCRTLGGQLACVSHAPLQEFITTLGKGRALWLGATDEVNEGQWVWVDETLMKYTAWAEGKPQVSRRNNYLIQGADGRWHDVPPDWPGVGFICEWEGK
jgi:hypothetical protein